MQTFIYSRSLLNRHGFLGAATAHAAVGVFGEPPPAPAGRAIGSFFLAATGSISWAGQRRDASQFGRALNRDRPFHGCCLCASGCPAAGFVRGMH